MTTRLRYFSRTIRARTGADEKFSGNVCLAFVVLALAVASWAQPVPETVNIEVHADQSPGSAPTHLEFFRL